MTKLDELRNDLRGTFVDAFGNSEGADELFNAIVNAMEERIIKLLDEYPLPHWSPTEYIEYTEGYITGFQDALALIQGEELVGIDPEDIALIKGEVE